MKNKMTKLTLAVASAILISSISVIPAKAQKAHKKIIEAAKSFVVATDYMPADGKTDVTEKIQSLIDANPNKTIIFPDGIYLISHPILTPAHPKKSVCLVLGNYAVIKADSTWQSEEAMVRLGGSYPANDIYTNGSNYGLYGGIIDGSDVAKGVSIDGGRETKIQDVSIKHASVGIYIKHGANSGSSDSDISDVNIVGNNKSNSIGVLIEGYDNTLSNMRIAKVNVGVWIKSGGNSLRNIHPLYIPGKDQNYETSCGFIINLSDNWLNFCYSDQFATSFKIKGSASPNLTDCFCFWYSGKVPFQTAIQADGPFGAIVSGLRIGFRNDCPSCTVLKSQNGGKGMLLHPVFSNRELSSDDVSASYIK